MFNRRTTGRHATAWRLLMLLAVFALVGSACSDADLEGLFPNDDPPAAEGGEAEEEPPAAEEPSEEPSEPAGDAGGEAEPADDAEAVEPITAEDVARVCADAEARATTAEELAPLVGLSAETFESVACESE